MKIFVLSLTFIVLASLTVAVSGVDVEYPGNACANVYTSAGTCDGFSDISKEMCIQNCKHNLSPDTTVCPAPVGGCRFAVWNDTGNWCHLTGDGCIWKRNAVEDTTTVDTKAGCADKSQYSADCGSLASTGDCDKNSQFYGWMRVNCAKSCGICEEEEEECPANNKVRCADGSRCIKEDYVCDDSQSGSWDCPGGTDEDNCEHHTCVEGRQKCSDGKTCIRDSRICDGIYDCPNLEDETGCKGTNMWRTDLRCGANYPVSDIGTPAQCNPDDPVGNYCCSSNGWCGKTADHCSCTTCIDYRHWTSTVDDRDTWIDYDVESSPLQIKTDSVPGTGSVDRIWVVYTDGNGNGGGLDITFSNPPTYDIGYCLSEDLSFTLPKAKGNKRIWSIAKSDTSLTLHCNGDKIFSFQFSDSSRTECTDKWGPKMVKFKFRSEDTASDYYYRPVSGPKECPAEVLCADGSHCIKEVRVCDGTHNCLGGTDEDNCEDHTCSEGYQKCSDGKLCIPDFRICDGVRFDCPDNKDEENCLGWRAVQRNVMMDFDLETTPLDIKTDSALVDADYIKVRFYTSDGVIAGGIDIFLTTKPGYWIFACDLSRTFFQTNRIPSAKDRLWRVTLTKSSGIRLMVFCNGVEVLDILMSSSTCLNQQYWSKTWNRDVAKIKFKSNDAASDYFRYRTDRPNCIKKGDDTGIGYRGHLSATKSNSILYCQLWAAQSPNRHTTTAANFPDSGLEHNYCRNPDGRNPDGRSDGVWCYNGSGTSPEWDYCDAPKCSD